MNLFVIAGLLLGITCLLLSAIIFWHGKKRLNYVWGAFNISVALWGVGAFLVGRADSAADAMFLWRFALSAVVWIAVFYFHIAAIFCEKEEKLKTLIFFAYFQGILFTFLFIFTNVMIDRIILMFDSIYYARSSNLIYYIFSFIWVGLVIDGLIEQSLFHQKAIGIKKNQVRYFFLGTLIGFLGGISNFLPTYGIDIYPIGNFTIPIYCLIVTYAILKHRLLDAKVVVTRGAILLFVYIFIVGIPASFVMIGKGWLIKQFQHKWFVPPLALYTVLALLGPYIYLIFQNRAEQKRIKQQIRLHQSLKAASKTTIEVQSIDKLSKIIPRYLLKLYKKLDNRIMHISMFLHDKDNNVYHAQSSVGDEKIPIDTLIREDSMLVKWFTVIRDKLVDEGVMRATDVDVLVYEDIDYWLNNPGVIKKPFKGMGKILKELKRIMESFKASIILPSVYQKELLGFLMLGEKTPDTYSISDISTFSILANDSAMAFKAAQLFEDLKIAQARLIQSEKLNLLGQLASSMAHEINNPLAIISGNVQLLLMDEEDTERKQLLDKISAQTERGYKIIHRLLNFSKLPKEEIKVINVQHMIDETLELINHKIKHGNFQLEKDYQEVPDIKGNPIQIQEVLLNLFVNGIQSMEEGGILKITTRTSKGKAEILVSDTGKGISEKDIKNIFDPFYTKGKENGTGLGLFVATQVMGLHKGSINVKSKVGHGTTFVLQFSLGDI